MKIIILSDDYPPISFGGAGIIASMHAEEFVKRGHQVYVLTTVQDKKLETTFERNGVIIYKIYSDYSLRWRDYVSIYNPKVISKVKNIFREIKSDVVHIHNIHTHLSYHVFLLARKYSKSVFMTAHDTMSVHLGKIIPKMSLDSKGERVFNYKVSNFELFKQYRFRWNPLRSFFIRYYLNKVDKVFSVSSALAEALKQNGVSDSEVMHNGIDAKSFFADEQTVNIFKDKYGLNNKKVMFFGGRISGMKGGGVALDTLKEVIKTIPNTCLLIVGKEDEYVLKLKNKIKDEGLSDYVAFTGWLDRKEIIPAYYASDVILVLSLYMDPFPTVNLEAMAAHKPIVATCYGGTPEAVVDNENGFVVDPYNIINTQTKTRSLLLVDDLRKKMGDVGYTRVLSEFSLKDIVDELEKIYANMISHE